MPFAALASVFGSSEYRTVLSLPVIVVMWVAFLRGSGGKLPVRGWRLEVERRVQEPAGGCLKFFLSHESFLLFFFRYRVITTPSSRNLQVPNGPVLDKAADR